MEPHIKNEDGDTAVTDPQTESAVVADLVARHIKPRVVNLTSKDLSHEVPVLVLPESLSAHSIEQFIEPHRTAPKRRKGTARLVELGSFIDLVNRFKDADSALFALPSVTTPSLLAVLDYNQANGEDDSEPGLPRFGDHRAIYTFPLSDEWVAWNAQNAKTMSQADFASFIEDRLLDVAPSDSAFAAAKNFKETLGVASFASPAKLLTLSRGLTVHVEDHTTNQIDPSTGETLLHYEATHKDERGDTLAVPRAFIIQIPVFREGAAYQFPVRLKYRAGSGRVTWSYEIHDLRRALDHAFREACENAREGTSLPLFYGAPES